ncbi:MAG: helix-turn-helix domain-containing protein, partial [Bacteroidota bacterium]
IRLQAQYAFASVRKRVAMSLYRLFEIFAFDEIEMPRDLLASLSAVSRGGLMRVLAEFREDGLIATDHTRLRILEADTLKQMPD